ncbi:MAG: hypothetical protein AMXMBFR13_13430 [Phycisphaerae bacterium]
MKNRRFQVISAQAALLWPASILAQQAHVIYTDRLSAGWQDWSWNTTRNLDNANPVHGAAGRSIFVQYDSGWAGFSVHNDVYLNAADYETMRFWIHGGTSGGQSIRVYAYDGAGAEGASTNLFPPPAGMWTQVEIPVASFGVSTMSRFAWQSRSASGQPVWYLDDIELTPAGPQPPGPGPDLIVDAAADRHPISPLIYGMSFADTALATELSLPINRWGGNATTRYNWQLDTSNRASDWYFENIPDSNPNPGQLPDTASTNRFIEQNLASNTETLLTVPLIGWTPKSREYACGFSVAKYGPQQDTDPWRPDCGNGQRPDGTRITGNDPADTSVAIGPGFVNDWITYLVGRYGSAGEGGVRFYNLDNEPMLWNSTHRDVHPAGATYDEMRERTWQYASAIKTVDPGARTLGPVVWGWCAYFYSAADNCARGADYSSHGNTHFVPWYLQQMRNYEQQHSVRILDYLDLHYYPQAPGVSLGSVGNAATQALRLRSTRSLWDPTYIDESWINQVQDGPTVRLIPRMREWVNAHYPGTKLAITEYNWGGLEHINGALAQADVLGIFGREALDLAALWGPPSSGQPAAFAFRVYRNYDGQGGQFGETAVRAVSADQGRVSAYAAVRSDNRLTVVLINKTSGALTSSLSIDNYAAALNAQVYRYSSADLSHIVREADLRVAAGTASVELPASSITLLVVPPRGVQADLDGDGDVDRTDVTQFINCRTGPVGDPPDTGCDNADLDGDDDVDQADFGVMQRCLSGPFIPADPTCAQ